MSALASSLRAGSGRGRESDSSTGSGRDKMICFWFKYFGQLPEFPLSLKVINLFVKTYLGSGEY